MEASSIFTHTQRYAAAALFYLALPQSQIYQTRPGNSLLSLDEETIGDGAAVGGSVSVSDNSQLWIHENSGLLWPIFRYHAAGAGLTGRKIAKRTESIEEFEFKAVGENHNQGRLAVGIFISGLAFDDVDFVKPWEVQNNNLERYVLLWESKNLTALSTAIQDWHTSKIAVQLMQQGAMMTVLSTLVVALAMPATLVTATDIIDNKWAIAVDRSDKAGELLAQVLLKGLQGNRPVTLVGFSMGARIIFKCLDCLADTEGDNGLFFLEHQFQSKMKTGRMLERKAELMVAGRFVNAYSTNDWTLGVAFRTSLLSRGLAGIQPVDFPEIENMTTQILEQLDLDDYYAVFRSSHAKPPESTAT